MEGFILGFIKQSASPPVLVVARAAYAEEKRRSENGDIIGVWSGYSKVVEATALEGH